ncbi:MAG: hypothetical protein Q4A89_00490 [Tannerella sp.]|nr:hypothetical protein [Tannerella sp.]
MEVYARPYASKTGLNPNYAIHGSAFTINNGRTNVRQWLRQAYSPPTKYDVFFPNASHWAELSRPFRALSAISVQSFGCLGVCCLTFNSTNKHFNNSTPEEHTRAESPDYFSPIPQGWGIDIRTLFAGLKA